MDKLKQIGMILVGILVAVLGVLTVIFKRKADQATTDAAIANTKGQDTVLKEDQLDVEKAISDLDSGIQKMKTGRNDQKDADANLNLEQLADKLKNGLK